METMCVVCECPNHQSSKCQGFALSEEQEQRDVKPEGVRNVGNQHTHRGKPNTQQDKIICNKDMYHTSKGLYNINLECNPNNCINHNEEEWEHRNIKIRG